MLGKKVFAAMLATVLGASLFGANAAKAVINLDATDRPAVTYATETLPPAHTDLDGHSVVMGGSNDVLNVTGAIGLGGPINTFVTIQFDLSGMVFSADVMGEHLTVTDPGADVHGDASLRAGGKVGDARVSFIVTRTSNTSAASTVTLSIDQLGVKPDVPGSVTMMVTDSVGDAEENTVSYTNAVLTKRALVEDAMAINLQAKVAQRFQNFGLDPAGMPVTMGTLGSFMVGAKMEFLAAGDGLAVGLEDIIGLVDDDAATVAMGSTVTISGNFAFAEMAWLQTAKLCSEQGATDLLQRDDDDETVVMDDLEAVAPPTEAMYLCISVPTGDEADTIPTTAHYMVTTEYAAGTELAGWLPNPGKYALGRITHDGTTVHIPYLTTWEGYNQRIVVSNRGTNSADYEITFRPEEGVTATPNDMYAMGTLDGGSTIVLKATDVVTLEGGSRTAATFVAEAQSTQIDVATVMVNLMSGSTDTVNYDPEPTD